MKKRTKTKKLSIRRSMATTKGWKTRRANAEKAAKRTPLFPPVVGVAKVGAGDPGGGAGATAFGKALDTGTGTAAMAGGVKRLDMYLDRVNRLIAKLEGRDAERPQFAGRVEYPEIPGAPDGGLVRDARATLHAHPKNEERAVPFLGMAVERTLQNLQRIEVNLDRVAAFLVRLYGADAAKAMPAAQPDKPSVAPENTALHANIVADYAMHVMDRAAVIAGLLPEQP